MGSSSSSRASPLPKNKTRYQNIPSRYPRNDRFAPLADFQTGFGPQQRALAIPLSSLFWSLAGDLRNRGAAYSRKLRIFRSKDLDRHEPNARALVRAVICQNDPEFALADGLGDLIRQDVGKY